MVAAALVAVAIEIIGVVVARCEFPGCDVQAAILQCHAPLSLNEQSSHV